MGLLWGILDGMSYLLCDSIRCELFLITCDIALDLNLKMTLHELELELELIYLTKEYGTMYYIIFHITQ